jgi:hypothetical protein
MSIDGVNINSQECGGNELNGIETQARGDRKTETTIAIRKPIHAAHPSAANHTGHQGRGGEFPQGMPGSLQFGSA